MCSLTVAIFQMLAWGWAALGLGCLLAEGLALAGAAERGSAAAPVERVRATPPDSAGT